MDCFVCNKCGIISMKKHEKCKVCGSKKFSEYDIKIKTRAEDLFGCDECGLRKAYPTREILQKAKNNTKWAKKNGYCICENSI